MADIKLEDLEKAQMRANEKSIKLNRAMGLEYLTVKKGYLVSVSSVGEEKRIRKPKFATKRVNYTTLVLKHVD